MSTYRRMNLDLFFYHNAQNIAPNEDLNVKPEMVEIAWKKNSGGTLEGTSTGKD